MSRKVIPIFLSLILLTVSSFIYAAPPHPDLVRRWMDEEGMTLSSQLPFTGHDPMPTRYAIPMKDGIEYVLVIRVDFPDKPATRSKEEVDGFFFGRDQVSLYTYYKEVSYGKMTISPGPMGGSIPSGEKWYRMPKKMSYYGEGRMMLDRYHELIRDACNAADPDVDFSKYDRDGDGYVDHLMLIHAGDDEASSGRFEDIWSMLIPSVNLRYDGVRINNVAVVAEEPSYPKPHLGIFFHEFFHDFGAPDLYSGSVAGVHDQQWSLMGMFGPYQGPNKNGLAPAHICGYLKWDFDGRPENGRHGWIKPVEISQNTEVLIIPAFETGDPDEVLYKIDIPGKEGKEFFLIENRQKKSGGMYDTYLPESGILIWHIDETAPRTDTNASKRVWVEDPSDPEHLDLENITAGAAYSLDDGQTEFTPSSKPNSNANDGTPSGISIVNIGREGIEMPITVYFGDTFEPNDTIQLAYGPLLYGVNYPSYIFDENDPADVYRIEFKKGRPVEIKVEDIPEGVVIDADLVDGLGNVLAKSKEGERGLIILYNPPGSGTGYLVVRRVSGYDPIHAYHVRVDPVIPSSSPPKLVKVYAYPNPANRGDRVRFHFELEGKGMADVVEISVFNLSLDKVYGGRMEGVIGQGEFGPWDLRDPDGRRCAAGIYLYLISARRGDNVCRAIGKLAVE
ncbi:TPA: M6 family metalloprotease domain-containing protein [Candidatus Poribacteria bacterium]|nr:M6 family metalloprotease domain-containing protein [Candidatus Poribacteria bacterium]